MAQLTISDGDLVVQCPEIIEKPQPEQAAGQQIDNAGNPFSHVHPMDTEKSQKRQENKGLIVIN